MASVAQEDRNTNSPPDAKLAGSPETTDTVTDDESAGCQRTLPHWTHKSEPATEPMRTMDVTLPLMFACSTSE